MDLRLIRNATLRLRLGRTDLLIDPMLGVRHSIRAMGDATERNPTVDLPCSIDEVIRGVDAVVVSHLHPDHFDEAAFGLVPRHLPVFCQPADADRLVAAGFDALGLDAPTTIGDLELEPVEGRHGSGPVLERMGPVLGLVLRAPGEPTVYWAGDTVLCDEVRATVADVRPDVVITHSGGATAGGTAILMDGEETIEIARLAPGAVVIAVHLDAVAHAPVTRDELRGRAGSAGIGPGPVANPVGRRGDLDCCGRSPTVVVTATRRPGRTRPERPYGLRRVGRTRRRRPVSEEAPRETPRGRRRAVRSPS